MSHWILGTIVRLQESDYGKLGRKNDLFGAWPVLLGLADSSGRDLRGFQLKVRHGMSRNFQPILSLMRQPAIWTLARAREGDGVWIEEKDYFLSQNIMASGNRQSGRKSRSGSKEAVNEEVKRKAQGIPPST